MTIATFQPVVFALLAAVCFGSALVVGRAGLRHASPLTGGTTSITFTALLWLLLSPFVADFSNWHPGGLMVFALVGIFYPAAVMALSYESNRVLGPTMTGAMSSTTPLFAIAAAVIGLGEGITVGIVLGGTAAVAGLILVSLNAPVGVAPGWRVVVPLSGAALRGFAQMLTKYGLTMWSSPFAAALIGYGTSTAVMWGLMASRSERGFRASRVGIMWFVLVGMLNGSAVLLTYHALYHGSVAVVSTVVATYPLFTLLMSAIFLKSERLTVRTILGVITVIIGIATVIWSHLDYVG